MSEVIFTKYIYIFSQLKCLFVSVFVSNCRYYTTKGVCHQLNIFHKIKSDMRKCFLKF
jgi:hypothetical protein